MGGDRIDYLNDVSTPTSDLTTAKCIINSTLSTKNAKCMVVDIKDFYLNIEMKRYEHMKLKLDIIPD